MSTPKESKIESIHELALSFLNPEEKKLFNLYLDKLAGLMNATPEIKSKEQAEVIIERAINLSGARDAVIRYREVAAKLQHTGTNG